MSLDLHGIRHDDVDRIVENYVLMNHTPLTIITGLSNQMRRLVKKVLNRHDFIYEIPVHNNGIIKVIGDK